MSCLTTTNSMMPGQRTVIHDAPVWRGRSDAVLRAAVPNAPDGGPWWEQLWAARVGGGCFELCCIPFATYDHALGDVVAVGGDSESEYAVQQVVRRSGRTVLRAWLADSEQTTWEDLQGLLRFRGLLYEFRKPALVAIDVSGEDAMDVEGELRQREAAGLLRMSADHTGTCRREPINRQRKRSAADGESSAL